MGNWVRVAGLAAGFLAAAAPAAAARCPHHVHVLARSGASIVYNRPDPRIYEGADPVYACRGPHGKPHRISQRGEWGFNYLDSFVFAGPFVAFQEDWGSAAGGAAYDVVVRDLRSGRIVLDASVSRRGADLGDSAEALLLKRNGSVAWLAHTGPEGGADDHTIREVHIADRDGVRVLDTDAAIADESLRMSRDRKSISWIHADEVRTAPFR